jgi:hypothetical protein
MPIFTANDDDGAPTTTLSQYVLRGTGQDGATETEITDRGKTLRPVTLAAHRTLAPRFVPQLISPTIPASRSSPGGYALTSGGSRRQPTSTSAGMRSTAWS